MVRRQLDLAAAMTTSFEVIKRYPALAIGGAAIYFALSFAIQMIPILGSLASILVTPPIVGGFTILSLNLVDDSDPKLEDLFSGFQAYGKWMGVYWLFALIAAAACLPAGIALLPIPIVEGLQLDRAITEPVTIGCIIAAAALVIGAFGYLIRYAFTYYVAVEAPGIWDSFRGSEAITEGNRLRILWMNIVLALVAAAGVLGLGIGVLLTIPLATLAVTALYRQLNPRQQWQPMAEPAPEVPPSAMGTPSA